MDEVSIFTKFEEYGNSNALAHKDSIFSYVDLSKRIALWEEQLEVSENQVIGIESDFSLDSIALVLSLIKRNVIAIR
jgi:hypothetical protein